MTIDYYSKEPDVWVKVDGYRIAAYMSGSGDKCLLALNGGPGLPSLDIRQSLDPLLNKGFRVISFDQLGTGKSDKPEDLSLWNIARYSREVEAVRRTLKLDKLNLLGHSWGGMLAIEYAVTFGENLNSLILEGTCADMAHFGEESRRLIRRLGDETENMMLRHEAEGTMDHPEYQAVLTILNYRHVWRTDKPWDALEYQKKHWNRTIYETMHGSNEFVLTGNLAPWNRLKDLRTVNCPTLIVVGEYDHITPDCSRQMNASLPNSQLRVLRDCGHVPRREAPDKYFPVLLDFLSFVT